MVDHFLFQFNFANATWSYVFYVGLFGVYWVIPKKNWLTYWLVGEIGLVQFCCVEFSSLVLCLLWTEQNYHTVKDVKVSEFQLKLSFIILLCEWAIIIGLSDSGTITNFTESLLFACNL